MASYVRYVVGAAPPQSPVTSVDGRCMGCGSERVTTGGCIRCHGVVTADAGAFGATAWSRPMRVLTPTPQEGGR
jgi:hypothetical protein